MQKIDDLYKVFKKVGYTDRQIKDILKSSEEKIDYMLNKRVNELKRALDGNFYDWIWTNTYGYGYGLRWDIVYEAYKLKFDGKDIEYFLFYNDGTITYYYNKWEEKGATRVLKGKKYAVLLEVFNRLKTKISEKGG